jgi:putative acyl-CoA dehydrogenase
LLGFTVGLVKPEGSLLDRTPGSDFETHEVFNQSNALADYNIFTTNSALVETVKREGAEWAMAELSSLGEYLGRAETIEQGSLANKYTPVLKAFDRFGDRIDAVEFHPAWHELLGAQVKYGIHSAPWAEPKAGAHVARAVGMYLFSEVENGTQCPVSMTYGGVPSLKKRTDLAATWLPKIYSRQYDKAFKPVSEKHGALIGMGMTEKQGGSDVRTNTTRATVTNEANGEYTLIGHKWFMSAPMCDGFMVLAQAPKGLSCFFMPRWLPDGTLNAIRIQRLKDKLGNRSNASSEVEFQNAHAWLVGEEGRGVPTIIDMATYTRLDCGLGTAGLMHQAVVQALHHASLRTAFQHKLIDQPIMQNVLADLVVEAEAATLLIMRLARAFDALEDENQAHFRRIVTPAAKYWICKRGPMLGAEALEVLGGNGYVEEGPLARIYREFPLSSIWEGSGNVMCLDVLRALSKSPDGLEVVRQEWLSLKGSDKRLDRYASQLEVDLQHAAEHERTARRLAERLALCLSASLMLKHAPEAVADAFLNSRLEKDWGNAFGTLPAGSDFTAIIARGSLMPTSNAASLVSAGPKK